MNKKIIYICAAVLLAAVCAVTVFAALYNGTLRTGSDRLSDVSITGEASIDGGAWQEIKSASEINLSAAHSVRIRGHFTDDISEGQQLMFRVKNIICTILINGETIFELKPADGSLMRSPGSGWAVVSSPGIKTGDEAELIISEVYADSGDISTALNSMCFGQEANLLREILHRRCITIILGCVEIAVGFMLMFLTVLLKLPSHIPSLSLGVFAIASGFWIAASDDYITLLINAPALTQTLYELLEYIQLVSFTAFSREFIKSRACLPVGIMLVADSIFMLTAIVCQLLKAADLYEFSGALTVMIIITGAVIFACMIYEAARHHREEAQLMSLSFCPLAIISVMIIILGEFRICMLLLQAAFLLLIFVMSVYVVKDMNRQVHQLEWKQLMENELIQSRVKLMLSQIQPHFLYNALAVIKELCVTNPEKAELAVDDFASFLHGNMDSITSVNPIRFSQELVHTRSYLDLEKMRFGDRLKVKYDLKVTDFTIPTLTLQPIVENAVRHGVTKKKEGGTIVIATDETSREWYVTVEDDGVGISDLPGRVDVHTPVGIENVRRRLEDQCGGSLSVKSEPGRGTKAIISIPKGEK